MKNQLEKYVGKIAIINEDGLKFEVEVKDIKTSYGRMRYLVSPVSGTGERWVEILTLKK